MRADVDIDVAALADKTHRAPHLGRADRIQPRLRIARGVQRQVSITPVGEILDCGDGIVGAGIDHRIGAERFGARSSRCALMSSAITRAPIALAYCVAASPTGPWPKIASVSLPDRF